jgi:hypothetical protein
MLGELVRDMVLSLEPCKNEEYGCENMASHNHSTCRTCRINSYNEAKTFIPKWAAQGVLTKEDEKFIKEHFTFVRVK